MSVPHAPARHPPPRGEGRGGGLTRPNLPGDTHAATHPTTPPPHRSSPSGLTRGLLLPRSTARAGPSGQARGGRAVWGGMVLGSARHCCNSPVVSGLIPPTSGLPHPLPSSPVKGEVPIQFGALSRKTRRPDTLPLAGRAGVGGSHARIRRSLRLLEEVRLAPTSSPLLPKSDKGTGQSSALPPVSRPPTSHCLLR